MRAESRYEYSDDCVAVIGMAMRVPGSDSLDGFWDNLLHGKVCRVRVPDEALVQGLHSGICGKKGYVPYKFSIDDYDLFDAEYFQMSPREASLTDPQHRLILEYAHRAFENAGHIPTDQGKDITGVFACSEISHYLMGNLYPHFCDGSIDLIETFVGTGSDFLATRVAYKCNFKGPAMSIQTACSSSLTTLHMATLSILGGECNRAVVASSTLLLPDLGYLYSPGGILSPDGLCRPFDANASGTVLSNGVVAVVLKSMPDALRDRDHIWAVIRGTGASNDGSDKMGFVAPSASGQARAIRSALSVASVRPEDIAYVEGHGTGTQLGDPIELEALSQVFSPACGRCPEPIVLGSVKGNVGHLNSTAGLCGFVKGCLCVYHGMAPGTALFTGLDPARGDIAPFTVTADNTQLRRDDGIPLLAGVSSFGFGGTNVHAVLQEPPCGPVPEKNNGARHLFVLSSPTKEGLVRTQAETAIRLEDSGVAACDAAFTFAQGRRHHQWRSSFVADSGQEAADMLRSGVPGLRHTAAEKGAVAFLFPGQGNLRARAGLAFYENDPLFRKNLDFVAGVILDSGGPDIVDVMRDGPYDLASTAIAQPLLFGLETAFARSLVSKGITPDCALGHSLGEYAAAVQAGVFSLEDGAMLVSRRAELMQSASGGKMLMVTLHRDNLRGVLGDLLDTVELAVVNGPANCVLSGSAQALDACGAVVEGKGQRAIPLKTSHAFHSVDMEVILAPFERTLDGVGLHPPTIPIASNVSGSWAGEEMATPQYWVRHLRRTVEFDRCLQTISSRVSLGIEVGPGHTMRSLAGRPDLNLTIASGFDSLTAPASDGQETAVRDMASVVGDVWEIGGDVYWQTFYAGIRASRLPLPETVLNPKRYWIDAPDVSATATKGKSLASFGVEVPKDSLEGYAAPENDVERALVEIWQELFFVRPIGVDEEFLALGGNSVQVMQMVRMAEERGLHFSVRDVFEAKTIRGLSLKTSQQAVGAASGADILGIPLLLGDNGTKGAYYSVFEWSGDVDHLKSLAEALAVKHDALRFRWDEDGVKLLNAKAVSWADEHVKSVIERFDGEPFWSGSREVLRPLPKTISPCDGNTPWFLQPIRGEKGGMPVVIGVFSRSIVDRPGAEILFSEMHRCFQDGDLPEGATSSWRDWLEIAPRIQETAFGLANPVTDMWQPLGTEIFEIDDGYDAIVAAGRKTRLSPGDFVAFVLAEIMAGEHLPNRVLKIWRNGRLDLSAFNPHRTGVGQYSYPVCVYSESSKSGKDALARFKENIHPGRFNEEKKADGCPVIEYSWLDSLDSGEAVPTVDLSVQKALGDKAIPATFYAGHRAGAVLLAVSADTDSALGTAQSLADRLISFAKQVVADEGLGIPVPADFPLCDLKTDELNRILEEAGSASK